MVLGLAGLAGLLVLGVSRTGGESGWVGESDRPARVAPGTPVTTPPRLAADLDVATWARDNADQTSIPARSLQAYAQAELVQRAATPECGLSWGTLAAIGRVESNHGRFHGSRPGADGVVSPPIIGVRLDGSNGTRSVPDTDGGRLDGDPVYDRAVGPMQFLPATWARFGQGGDPQRIDDAAVAAAAYLCSGDRDIASADGWWDGVLAYNRSVEYARLVWAAADRYAGAVGVTSASA